MKLVNVMQYVFRTIVVITKHWRNNKFPKFKSPSEEQKLINKKLDLAKCTRICIERKGRRIELTEFTIFP